MRRDFGREVMESRVKGMSLVRHLICGPRHTGEEAFLDNLEKMRLAGLKFGRCLCDTATNAVVILLNNAVSTKSLSWNGSAVTTTASQIGRAYELNKSRIVNNVARIVRKISSKNNRIVSVFRANYASLT